MTVIVLSRAYRQIWDLKIKIPLDAGIDSYLTEKGLVFRDVGDGREEPTRARPSLSDVVACGAITEQLGAGTDLLQNNDNKNVIIDYLET